MAQSVSQSKDPEEEGPAAVRHELAARAPIRFCGLILRGTASSGYAYFLEAEVLLLALEAAVRRLAWNYLIRVGSLAFGRSFPCHSCSPS